MTSPGRRKKHGLATEKRPGGGLRQPSQKTWVTVAKNTTDAENTPYRCKKHGRPSQKTCPPTRTVTKNARHRCKKHLPQEPWQKTRKLATVAKNMSYRRKKHATLNTVVDISHGSFQRNRLHFFLWDQFLNTIVDIADPTSCFTYQQELLCSTGIYIYIYTFIRLYPLKTGVLALHKVQQRWADNQAEAERKALKMAKEVIHELLVLKKLDLQLCLFEGGR